MHSKEGLLLHHPRTPRTFSRIRSLRFVICGLLSLLFAGCEASNTQLVLTVDSDLEVETQLGGIEIRRMVGQQIAEDPVRLRIAKNTSENPKSFVLPLSFAAVPPDGDSNQTVTFDVVALGPNMKQELFTRRVISGFRAGARLLVPVFLSKDCLTLAEQCSQEMRCDGEDCRPMTCTENGCASPEVDVSQLSEIDPGQETQATIKAPTNLRPDAAPMLTNEPPSPPQISLSSTVSRTTEPVDVIIQQPGVDPENAPLNYRYRWFKNGVSQADPQGATLPPTLTKKGDTWRVDVRSNDGLQTSLEASTASVSIINTAPELRLTYSSTSVRATDRLAVNLSLKDADNDPLELHIQWWLNNDLLSSRRRVGVTQETLTESLNGVTLSRGQAWHVKITASDGTESMTAQTPPLIIQSTPPAVTRAWLRPTESEPRTTSDIVLAYETDDADLGDRIAEVTIDWLADGQKIVAAPNTLILDSRFTQKHQLIQAEVTVVDQTDQSSGSPFRTAPLRIENSPPVLFLTDIVPVQNPANVNCSQAPCTATNDFRCEPGAAIDADGDPVEVRFEWFQSNVFNNLGHPFQTLLGTDVERSWQVLCGATPFDGENEGQAVLSPRVNISNSKPKISTVEITPSSPREEDIIRAEPLGWQDSDGDPESYQFDWYADGQAIPNANQDTLDGDHFDKGQSISVRVTPFDGLQFGTPVQSSTVVTVNTQPVIVGLRLSPNVVFPNSPVTVQYDEVYDPDPADAQSVSVTYRWMVDNALESQLTTDTIPGSYLLRDRNIRASVIPYDGEEDGPTAQVSLTVRNTPPPPPRVTIQPAAPLAGEPLTCQTQTFFDDESDVVSVEYQWRQNGVLTGITTASVASGETKPNDRWTCESNTFDGRDRSRTENASVIIPAAASPTVYRYIAAAERMTCVIQEQPDGILCWDKVSVLGFFPGSFKGFIDAGPSQICALNQRNEIFCASSNAFFSEATSQQMPNEWQLAQIVYGGSRIGFCHLRTDNAIECVNNPRTYPGPFSQIIGGANFVCGLKLSGRIRCIGRTFRPPAGQYTELESRWSFARAKPASSAPVYDDDWETFPSISDPRWGGEFVPKVRNKKKHSISAFNACALDSNGSVYCASLRPNQTGVEAVPDALFSDIAVGQNYACGISTDGEILCWGDNQAPLVSAPGTPSGLQLSKVAVGQGFACGLSSSGRLRCWGSTHVPYFRGPTKAGLTALGHGVTYVDLWANDTELCARRESGEIDCFGDYYQRVKAIRLYKDGSSDYMPYAPTVLLEDGRAKSLLLIYNTSPFFTIQGCEFLSEAHLGCVGPGQILQNHTNIFFNPDKHRVQSNTLTRPEIVDYAWYYSTPYTLLEGNRAFNHRSGVTYRFPYANPSDPIRRLYASHRGFLGMSEGRRLYALSGPPRYFGGHPFRYMTIRDIETVLDSAATTCVLIETQNGLAAGGQAYCIGNGSLRLPPFPPRYPLEEYTKIAGSYNLMCAVTNLGNLYCTGKYSGYRYDLCNENNYPCDDVSATSLNNGEVCALRRDGSFRCTNFTQYHRYYGQVLDANNTDFIFNGLRGHCGLDQSLGVQCSTPDFRVNHSERFIDLKIKGYNYEVCSIRPNGSVWCSQTDLQPPVNQIFSRIAMAGNRACGISVDTSTQSADSNRGRISCWGDLTNGSSSLSLNMQNRFDYTHIGCEVTHCCALNGDGEVQCFGRNLPSNIPSGQGYVDLVYGTEGGCALDSGGRPHCFGEAPTNYPPVYVTP